MVARKVASTGAREGDARTGQGAASLRGGGSRKEGAGEAREQPTVG